MKKVLLVTILERSQQLLHDARNVNLLELHLLVLHQSHQIMFHVLEDEIKRPTVLAKVHRLLFVGDYLAQLHNVLVVELAENFYLAHRRDGEAFFLVL